MLYFLFIAVIAVIKHTSIFCQGKIENIYNKMIIADAVDVIEERSIGISGHVLGVFDYDEGLTTLSEQIW
jgi:hypothetical protein